jgi:hypothetical protein
VSLVSNMSGVNSGGVSTSTSPFAPATEPGGSEPELFERIIEIVAVVLLGITTIGTAWCGYQSVQWSGESSDHAQAASDKHVEAARLFGLATQKVAYDSTTTAQYAAAVATGNTRLQTFYRSSLVRKGFLPTLDRWEAQIKAGQTPVPLADDPEYLDSQLADYRKVSSAAEEDTQLGIEAGATASAYVSVTILLAAALFFSGVVSSFRYRPARALLLASALATLAFAASRMASLPVLLF